MPERVLDTNILWAYVRQGPVGLHVEARHALRTSDPLPIISVVVEGEIRALALPFGWGPVRVQTREELLGYSTVIPLPFENIVEVYAEIDDYSRRRGVAIGKNDLWTAATAHVTGAWLLTTDRGFDHLHTVHLERDWVDPAAGRGSAAATASSAGPWPGGPSRRTRWRRGRAATRAGPLGRGWAAAGPLGRRTAGRPCGRRTCGGTRGRGR